MGLLRWRLADGREVGRQTGMYTFALSVSRDSRWVVCGTRDGASVWDGEIREKVIHTVEDTNDMYAVDVSLDSTRFATGARDGATIWSITSGQRLVGPLEHDNSVNGIRFSPTGEHCATTCARNAIQIFDSHTGDNLITLNGRSPDWQGTPLAWSGDGQQIFTASGDNKVRSFNVSTGSKFTELRILHDDGDSNVLSIALSANGKSIATFAGHSILVLDTSTLKQIGPVIKES